MSTEIYWRPVKDDLTHFSSSSKLCSIIDQEFGMPCKIGNSEIAFIRGLLAAGYEDCSEIIEAIRKYEQIEIRTF